jgi:endonuclease/exonuclease/phosphatase family metal-dependent hydrolase
MEIKIACTKFLLLLAMFAATDRCCLAAQPSEAENKVMPTVRVMSFNIRNGKANDGPNHWSHRKELVLQTVRQFDPDILGAQEMMIMQADYFKKNLPEYEHHGTSRAPSDVEEEQCAVFFRKSRFEKLQAGHFWLSETPDVPGSKSWDSAFPRMVSWVQLSERDEPESVFFVFNTHFDHRGREARLQSAAIIRVQVQEIAAGAPSVVIGDFNSAEASLVHQVLLFSTSGLALADSYRSQHADQDPTAESTSSRWKGNRSGSRIDWILSSPQWSVSEAAIDRSNDEGRYPSGNCGIKTLQVVGSGNLATRKPLQCAQLCRWVRTDFPSTPVAGRGNQSHGNQDNGRRLRNC